MMKILFLLSLVGRGSSRSMTGSPTLKCMHLVQLETDCNRNVQRLNVTGLVSKDPRNINVGIVDEFCRYVTEHETCVMNESPFMMNNCPEEMKSLVYAASNVVFNGCYVYKKDLAGIIPCLKEDSSLLSRIVECEKKVMNQIGSYFWSGECSDLDLFGNCIDLFTPCAPQHADNLKQFLHESRDSMCALLKGHLHQRK